MKNSNKVLLAVIICFLLGTVFVVVAMRSNHIVGELVPRGKGKIVTKNFTVSDFSELDLSGFARVIIKDGEQSKVSVSANEDYISNIVVDSSKDKLMVNAEQRIRTWHNGEVEIVIVTKNQLKKITISGASHLDYANINGDSLVLEVSGSTHCDLTGKINSLQIESGGTNYINAKNLIADDVSLEASGETHPVVYVKNFLKVDLSGVTKIIYYGNPKRVVKDVSGMASIEPR